MRGTIYIDHGKSHLSLPGTLSECEGMAKQAAQDHLDGLYRFFVREGSGERFITSYSSFQGKFREHKDVTIPAEHF